MIILIAMPLYTHAALCCPSAKSELESNNIAWIVGIDDLSSASPSNALMRRIKHCPAVVWFEGSSYTSGRSENFETEK